MAFRVILGNKSKREESDNNVTIFISALSHGDTVCQRNPMMDASYIVGSIKREQCWPYKPNVTRGCSIGVRAFMGVESSGMRRRPLLQRTYENSSSSVGAYRGKIPHAETQSYFVYPVRRMLTPQIAMSARRVLNWSMRRRLESW